MRKITNEELGRPSAEEFAAMEKMPVTVVLDNVRSAQNVGAFFRTGDAFAVERIVLCGIPATPPSRGRRPSTGATGPSKSRRPGPSIRSTSRCRAASFYGVSFAKSVRSVNFAAL